MFHFTDHPLSAFLLDGKIQWQVEEVHFVEFLSKLLETKILQVLRFKHGQVHAHLVCFISACSAHLYN